MLWYTTETGGTGSSNAPTPSTANAGTTNYYVSQTVKIVQSPRAIIAVTVNSIPSAPTVTGPVTYCRNATATALTANGSNLLWYTTETGGTGSSNAPTPSTANAGTTNYYVSQSVNDCESERAIIIVTVNPLPQVSILPLNSKVCIGNSIMLNASGALSYNWNDGRKYPSIIVTQISTTTYSVTGTDINGCAATTNRIVKVSPLPNVIISGNSAICQGQSTIRQQVELIRMYGIMEKEQIHQLILLQIIISLIQ